jgi:hypothetical protein
MVLGIMPVIGIPLPFFSMEVLRFGVLQFCCLFYSVWMQRDWNECDKKVTKTKKSLSSIGFKLQLHIW